MTGRADIDGLHGAVAVSRDGSMLLTAAGGVTDARAGTPCQPGSRFQVASVSKQFAATAALLLADRGALHLHEPVTAWLPGCPPAWRQVTLHHLVTHTSGIGHWSQAPGFVPDQPMSLEERIDLLLTAPLLDPPGTRWRYSSPGYLMVGHLLARAAGTPYATFLTEEILATLGMTSTTAGPAPDGPGSARGHHAGQPVPLWDASAMTGTGDLRSTVEDLVHHLHAVHTGSLLSPMSRYRRTTPHTPVDDRTAGPLRATGYGYGVFTGTLGDEPVVFHPGDVPGHVSLTVWLPRTRTAIAVLSNEDTTDLDTLLDRLLPAMADAGAEE